MQCSFPLLCCWWCLLLLTAHSEARSAPCPLIGAKDVSTKAYLSPLVFHGRLLALDRRGPAILQATFRVDKVFKGGPLKSGATAPVEFAIRFSPSRCRGAPYQEGELQLAERYVVFAAWRRPRRMIAVARPEPYSKRKAVAKVLCPNCAKPPSIRGLVDERAKMHAKVKLKCRISGNPPPKVVWFKDGLKLKPDGRVKLRAKRKYSHLIINKANLSDIGEYECIATNVLGNATASATVSISTITTDSTLWPFVNEPCPKKNFCLNGGVCIYIAVVKEYACECAEGYGGQRCQNKAISTLSNDTATF
ncbi:pro-neuregulin-2, membrane-bound isoform isoform X2 [Parasteatoda tepidariorum]|uniref:pro-neuregulin-2, membrane-bound isoform isoform X2 n=1 Tax=Parasteatoda tepidariorum TaxID=114398 RepID=UPI00077FD959|nr:pro-neuregulin-2, membrane-bound isoform isoform X2 [Parasteatoda tepidariorum]